ncbi:MAG: ComF family protein [Verrucomicrobiae bacterium]|nr:ComF family protein [Verrucomicrobiae bacterium]MCX7722616.1 ComF family protein [Verrucomicrobiae bacterium]MDW7979751.1 ComF family protein [Verrucomicrobiales bacterium]
MVKSFFNAALAQWRRLGNALLGLLFPDVCQVCRSGRATAAQGYVCDGCRARVRFVQPPVCDRCGMPYPGEITVPFECRNCSGAKLYFSRARAAVTTDEPIREVIHRYKYQSAVWFEPFLAELFIMCAAPELTREKVDLIVPVPLHPARKRERGFNQAERLGARLAAATSIPMDAKTLRRVLYTPTQTLLTRDQRAKNMRGAFAVRRGRRLDGARIVLVDDVFTTGATTNACAKALIEAGAAEVRVWTVARGN